MLNEKKAILKGTFCAIPFIEHLQLTKLQTEQINSCQGTGTWVELYGFDYQEFKLYWERQTFKLFDAVEKIEVGTQLRTWFKF